jgi:hypothetical protein
LKSADIREITLSLNIKLRISKVSNEVEIAMTWLIDALNNVFAPKKYNACRKLEIKQK